MKQCSGLQCSRLQPSRLLGRTAVLIAVVALLGLVGCGRDGGAANVSAGRGASGPDPSSTTTTTAARSDDAGPSPVDGLDAVEFRDAVTAPPSAAARAGAARGPVADTVTLADGRTAWRVRIPGDFPLRSAQATMTVGGRDIGIAASPPTLDALIAVTLDGTGLVAGAPVIYRWGRGSPVSAGPLEVVG